MIRADQHGNEARRLLEQAAQVLPLGVQAVIGFLNATRALHHAELVAPVRGALLRLVQFGDINRVLQDESNVPVLVQDRRMRRTPEAFFQDDLSVPLARNPVGNEGDHIGCP